MHPRVSKRCLLLITILLLLTAFLVTPVMAADETVSVTGVPGVTVDACSNGTATESGGTVTITVAGSFTASKQTTVTIKNTSGSTATISFDYSVSNHDSSVSTIDDLANADSGSYSVLLTDGGTKTFVISSKKGLPFSEHTATATLKNFKVVAAAAESNVTVTYGSLGSVKIDGTTVASGSVKAVSSATGSSFVATPGSGSKFVAWINPATNAVISTSATYQVIPTEDMAIKAVFTNASSAPVFWADGTAKLFESLDAALSYVSSASNKVISLASDATLPAGNYTIPADVTLLIPFDSANTLYTTTPGDSTTYTKPTAYRTLKMANGANITVNGALSVSAKILAGAGGGATGGSPIGPCGWINMAEGSSITVGTSGALYVYGYITGSGTVTAKGNGSAGATVYECFQFGEYRGGTQSTAMKNGVFAVAQYYVQNIEVALTLEAGASEYCWTKVHVSVLGTQGSTAKLIGTKDAMFNLTQGSVTKRYDGDTDRLCIDLNGTVKIASVSVQVSVRNITSEGFVLSLNNNMTININSGSTVETAQDLAFIPGSELYIHKDAQFVIGSGYNVYVYDADQWNTFVYGEKNLSNEHDYTFIPIIYAPGQKYTRTDSDLKDALVCVDGTLDASQGKLYTTYGPMKVEGKEEILGLDASDGGANIYSTKGGIVKLGEISDGVTYRYIQNTSGTYTDTYFTIPVESPQLKNGDGSYLQSAADTYVYNSTTGVWECTNHNDAAADGDHTCDVCGQANVTTCADAAGDGNHTCDECSSTTALNDCTPDTTKWSSDATYHWHDCTECGADSSVAAHADTDANHLCDTCSYKVSECADTDKNHDCDLTGCSATVGTCEDTDKDHYCDYGADTEGGCRAYFDKHEDSADDGDHICDYCESEEKLTECDSNVELSAVDPTCTQTGLTAGTKCSDCGATQTAQTEIPALGHDMVAVDGKDATCTEDGYTAYTDCSRCDHVEGKTVIPAKGHSMGEWIVDTAATCTEAGSKHKECANCDHEESEVISALGHDMVAVDGKDATCTEDGYTAYTDCSRCDHVEGKTVIPAKGHSMGEWIVDTAATCTEDGSKHKECANCDHEESEVISALGHDMVAVDGKDATCTEDGYTAYTDCSRCDHTEGKEVISAAGHTYGDWTITKEATCTEDGSKQKTCTCGDVVTEAIAALGHTAGDVVVENNVDATCTTDGSYDNVVYCTVCGEELSRETITVDALGHTDSNPADHVCDVETCKADLGDCVDENSDNVCDVCNASLGYTVSFVNYTKAGTNSNVSYLATVKIGDTTVTGDPGAAVAATLGGEGKFTVSCTWACVALIETTNQDGTKSYDKLTAEATSAENTYEFTIEKPSNGMVIVVIHNGDVDADGTVNTADRVAIARAIYIGENPNLYKALSALGEKVADVDFDGAVNTADRVGVARAIYIGENPNLYKALNWVKQ